MVVDHFEDSYLTVRPESSEFRTLFHYMLEGLDKELELWSKQILGHRLELTIRLNVGCPNVFDLEEGAHDGHHQLVQPSDHEHVGVLGRDRVHDQNQNGRHHTKASHQTRHGDNGGSCSRNGLLRKDQHSDFDLLAKNGDEVSL